MRPFDQAAIMRLKIYDLSKKFESLAGSAS